MKVIPTPVLLQAALLKPGEVAATTLARDESKVVEEKIVADVVKPFPEVSGNPS